MASNDLEVLDPVAPVEQVMESKSGSEIDRRHFFAAMGVAGITAGAALFSASSADAQQPSQNGYAQVDVMNFLLNIKYLKATLYSYVTQGTDLPGSSFVTLGTGQVFNPVAKVTFSSQQITDVFNEMYYDELNQLIALRAQQGVAVAPRQSMNLLGTGPSGSAPPTATVTLVQSQVIALARMLEDLSASAFAAATVYLTGTNLTLAAQALASDGQHAGLIRLLAIQNGVQYQGTQYASVATSNSAQSAVTFTGATQSGNPLIIANLGANVPAVGAIVTGIGIPPGAGAVIKSLTNTPATTFNAIPDGTNILKGVTSTTGLLQGQPITGTFVPAGSFITNVGTNTVTIGPGTTTSGSATVKPTGFVNGTTTVTGVSSTTGLIVGQVITGTFIQTSPATTVAGFSSSAATITLSQAATGTSVATVTGNTVSGSTTVSNLSSQTVLIAGQAITGPGIQAGTTITNLPTSTTLTLSLAANATGTKVTLSVPATETLTSPTTQTYTVSQSQITLAGNATVTGFNTFSIALPDNEDVEPGDPGTAALSAAGPSAIAGTSPTVYQGFFNTAGAGTAGSTSTPAGFAFAKTFQQVLAVLYGYNSTNSIIVTQNFEGGFFPVGVSGPINSAI